MLLPRVAKGNFDERMGTVSARLIDVCAWPDGAFA